MGLVRRMSVVALAASLIGCADFVGVENASADDDGSSSTTDEPDGATTAAESDSDSTTAASDSATSTTGTPDTTSTTNPVDPSDPTMPDPTRPSSTYGSDSTGEGDTTDSAEGSTGRGEDDTGDDETGAGESDTTGPMECQQLDTEPNDASGDAFDLGNVGACADGPMQVSGTIGDATDRDWAIYGGVWDCASTNNPNHVVTVTSGEVFVCLYPVCPSNGTQTTCLAGETVVSANDVTGCCSDDEAIADVNCFGTGDESANGFVLVGPLDGAPECTDYTFDYDVVDA